MIYEDFKTKSMSVAECCDWLAHDDGFTRVPEIYDGKLFHPKWQRNEEGKTAYYAECPIVPTLDAAARCIPDGFNVIVDVRVSDSNYGTPLDRYVIATAHRASAMGGSHTVTAYVSANDELTARFRLAVETRMALKRNTYA